MLFRTRPAYGKRDVWSNLLARALPGTGKTRAHRSVLAHSQPNSSA